MISKLNFRLAPPSADETFHCLSSLLHNNGSNSFHADVLSAGSYYLKKARARTCWFRHSPYTLAVAALATTYNSMGLGKLRRRLLRECDARARAVTGRGVDIHGVAACAEAMANERAAAAAAAAATARAMCVRGSTESPVCGGGGVGEENAAGNGEDLAVKSGWGSPTGVAQGAELMQKAAFSAAAGTDGGGARNGGGGGGGGGGVPLVEDFSPPRKFSPCGAVETKAASHVVAGRRAVRRVSSSSSSATSSSRVAVRGPRGPVSPRDIAAPSPAREATTTAPVRRVSVSTSPLDVERTASPVRVPGASHQQQLYRESQATELRPHSAGGGGQKRRLHQTSGSCFVPCSRRRLSEGKDCRRVDASNSGTTIGAEMGKNAVEAGVGMGGQHQEQEQGRRLDRGQAGQQQQQQ